MFDVGVGIYTTRCICNMTIECERARLVLLLRLPLPGSWHYLDGYKIYTKSYHSSCCVVSLSAQHVVMVLLCKQIVMSFSEVKTQSQAIYMYTLPVLCLHEMSELQRIAGV